MLDTEYAAPLALCQALQAAGLWLTLRDPDALVVGPTSIARQHPDLLEQIRTHKPVLLAMLRETLAYDVLGAHPGTEGHFVTEVCDECHQSCWVITPPRRLALHRTVDGTVVCPGAVWAQEAIAHQLLSAFITTRCVQRDRSIVTWLSLRGALMSWASEQGVLLPPRPYLLTWLDQHYARMGTDAAYPSWQGLTFSVWEWLGDDETPATPPGATPAATRRPVVLTA